MFKTNTREETPDRIRHMQLVGSFYSHHRRLRSRKEVLNDGDRYIWCLAWKGPPALASSLEGGGRQSDWKIKNRERYSLLRNSHNSADGQLTGATLLPSVGCRLINALVLRFQLPDVFFHKSSFSENGSLPCGKLKKCLSIMIYWKEESQHFTMWKCESAFATFMEENATRAT